MNQIASFVKRQGLTIFCASTIALSFAATLLPLPGEVVPVVMVFRKPTTQHAAIGQPLAVDEQRSFRQRLSQGQYPMR